MQYIETRTELELLLKDEAAQLEEIKQYQELLNDANETLADIRNQIKIERNKNAGLS